MKQEKKRNNAGMIDLGLDAYFDSLEEQTTVMIDTLSDIRPLRSARKELKQFRMALRAIRRQVHLYEKDPRP